MKNQLPAICLTFDVEEFDLLLEFHQRIDPAEQLEVGKRGLDIVSSILTDEDVSSTLFTTGTFAKAYPELMRSLAAEHEIGSHSMFHSNFKKSDLLDSRLVLEEITGSNIRGFRMPRLKPIDTNWLKDAGYSYDSSIQPTYIPGRYNNFHLPRTVYRENDFRRIPCSVTPNLRIPLFWLSFKNFPYSLFLKLAIQTLKKDKYLVLYFHPWEFTDISNYKLPFYIARHSGIRLQEKLRRLINDLKNEANFCTMNSLVESLTASKISPRNILIEV